MTPVYSDEYPRLWPGCQVVLAKENAASGATIAYHGTVLRLHRQSVREHPNDRRRWRYSVFIPCRQKLCQRSGRELLPLDLAKPPGWTPAKRFHCEFDFDRAARYGSAVIRGRFHLRRRAAWDRFEFRVSNRVVPAYSLCCSPQSPAKPWNLKYEVPLGHTLGCDYVIGTINRMFQA